MKKYMALLLLLTCAPSFFGCSETNREKKTQISNGFDSIVIENPETSAEIENTERDISPFGAEYESSKERVSVSDFSFAEDKATYREGSLGVKIDGFANKSETEITAENVSEHAKNECTVDYDRTEVYFDTDESVWKVHFYKSGTLGGDQSVYMNRDGKTLLVVYGE